LCAAHLDARVFIAEIRYTVGRGKSKTKQETNNPTQLISNIQPHHPPHFHPPFDSHVAQPNYLPTYLLSPTLVKPLNDSRPIVPPQLTLRHVGKQVPRLGLHAGVLEAVVAARDGGNRPGDAAARGMQRRDERHARVRDSTGVAYIS